MSKVNDFQPNWASTPGDTIADVLKDKDLSLATFAKKMNSSIEHVRDLIHGYITITEDIAKRLEKVLGASTEFWLRREAKYQESKNRIADLVEQKWVNDLPLNDMTSFGWLERTNDVVKDCLKYFDVPDVWAWRKKYNEAIAMTAFRKSAAIRSVPESVSAWLRQGEIVAESVNCRSWDPVKFADALKQLKSLTKKKRPQEFLPQLKSVCAECGVALAIVRTPKGCSASGATKFLSDTKAMILLSFRYLSDDHFWFTFFHEAGHLLLHSDRSLFLEEVDSSSKNNVYEIEANQFATDVLLPKELQARIKTIKIDKRAIIELAKGADVSLGIVIGQLQHAGRLDFKSLNSYKRRYNWEDILE